MSRELIVSVNGKEKKIAIVENDRVTEFYIERGEQNQGIVGNIYKGRVMRVLPGMQSAFVDIGLERDAFLYVTDFFDEEAEFERIVVDKSKKVDPETATRAATERIEQSRVEREHHIEGAQERAEPLREAPLVEVEAALVAEKPEESEEGGPRRRGRRGGRGRGRTTRTDGPEERRVVPTPAEPIDTPFVTTDSSFERISDDEERAMNLLGDATDCNIPNLVNWGYIAPSMFGPLQPNGGPTLTIALLPGSPAIDAAFCRAPSAACCS